MFVAFQNDQGVRLRSLQLEVDGVGRIVVIDLLVFLKGDPELEQLLRDVLLHIRIPQRQVIRQIALLSLFQQRLRDDFGKRFRQSGSSDLVKQVELYLVEPVEFSLGQRGFPIELRQELQHFGEQRIICLFDRHSLRNHRPDQLYDLLIRDRFVLCDDPLA